jgi:Putative beta-barrel porin 2
VRATTGIYVLTILCFQATGLSAQEATPADPIESMPFRFGPLGLNPTVTITNFGIDSNVFNEAEDPQRDFTMTFTPRVQARLRGGRVLLSGALATNLNYYQKFDDERSADYFADGRADVDFGWFQPYGSASRIDTRERLNAELDLRAPRVQNDLAAGARFLAGSKTGLVLGVRHSSLTFDEASVFDDVTLSRTMNSKTDTVEGGLEFYLTPLTTVSVVGSRQQDRFVQSPARDSDTWRVMPSIRMEAPAIVEGSFAIGYRHFDGIDPTLPDYTGLVFKGALGHTFWERTRLDLQLSRDVQYSFEETTPYYLTTAARLTLRQQLNESVDLHASAGRERLDYRVQDEAGAPTGQLRLDRADVVSAGAGYRLQSNVRIGVDVEYARRLSDRADRAYDRTRVLGSFSYGF